MMSDLIEVVEFVLGGSRYALDIRLVREIFEMMPVTQIPHTLPHIAGVVNIRGEITYLVNINALLQIPETARSEKKYIIVFMGDATGGTNVGILVDTVTSVTGVTESQIEYRVHGVQGTGEQYIKGIISLDQDDGMTREKQLVIWLDIQRMLRDSDRKEYQRTG
jgi:purine-binding chemotaxis protein CheW